MATSDSSASHVELVREYRFEAAHRLPGVPLHHRCARLHGHSYRIEVAVSGPVNADTGWLVDFYDMDQVVQPVIAALDHRLLNDITGLENPTSERLCFYLWNLLAPILVGLSAITVWETTDARCVYKGPSAARLL